MRCETCNWEMPVVAKQVKKSIFGWVKTRDECRCKLCGHVDYTEWQKVKK